MQTLFLINLVSSELHDLSYKGCTVISVKQDINLVNVNWFVLCSRFRPSEMLSMMMVFFLSQPKSFCFPHLILFMTFTARFYQSWNRECIYGELPVQVKRCKEKKETITLINWWVDFSSLRNHNLIIIYKSGSETHVDIPGTKWDIFFAFFFSFCEILLFILLFC